MLAAPLVLVPLATLIAIVGVGVTYGGLQLWMEGGMMAWAATTLAALLAVSSAGLGAAAQAQRAWLGALAVALAPLPWALGVAGTALGLRAVASVLTLVAPEEVARLVAQGYSEAMVPRIIGATGTAGLAAGLAIALALMWLLRDRARGEHDTAVGAIAAAAVFAAAIAAATRAAHAHDLMAALAPLAAADRVTIASRAGWTALGAGSLGVGAVAIGVAVGGTFAAKPTSRAATTVWIALGFAAAVIAAGASIDLRYAELFTVMVRTPRA